MDTFIRYLRFPQRALLSLLYIFRQNVSVRYDPMDVRFTMAPTYNNIIFYTTAKITDGAVFFYDHSFGCMFGKLVSICIR